MLRFFSVAFAALFTPSVTSAADPPLRFEKRQLTDRYYCDGVTAADIDRDGQVDVVAGPCWYAGPEFTVAREFYPAVPLPPEVSPSNSMYSFVRDFSGDGWPDILVLGRVKLHAAYWYENPRAGAAAEKPPLWDKHFAFERVRGESPTLVDLDGDGRPQVICHWDGRWGWIEPDPAAPRDAWRFVALSIPGDSGLEPDKDEGEWRYFYHGEGVGDVNSDGRLDLLLNDGWYEQPPPSPTVAPQILAVAPAGPTWMFHRGTFSTDRGGAQMFADDVDADGDADVITALNAHGYGLAWFERLNADEANRTLPASGSQDAAPSAAAETITIGDARFRRHLLMSDRENESTYGVCFTQPHALEYADLNGDSRRDIIVGKRMWAHGPTGDVEPQAAPVLYWFEHTRRDDGTATFVPHLIDDRSGVGVQITVADLNADQRPDILTASKLGVFAFLQR
jgi:hypothetical protein